MKRYDLRHLGNDFDKRLSALCSELNNGEVIIVIFEVREFSNVEKAQNIALEHNNEILNSIRFNEVDWTIVLKGAHNG